MKNGDQPINHITEAEKDRHDASQSLIYLGLTKREQFAAMAMQGILSSCFASMNPQAEDLAQDALNYADALLA